MRVKIFDVWVQSQMPDLAEQNEVINDFCKKIEEGGGKILNIDTETVNRSSSIIVVSIVYKERKD